MECTSVGIQSPASIEGTRDRGKFEVVCIRDFDSARSLDSTSTAHRVLKASTPKKNDYDDVIVCTVQ